MPAKKKTAKVNFYGYPRVVYSVSEEMGIASDDPDRAKRLKVLNEARNRAIAAVEAIQPIEVKATADYNDLAAEMKHLQKLKDALIARADELITEDLQAPKLEAAAHEIMPRLFAVELLYERAKTVYEQTQRNVRNVRNALANVERDIGVENAAAKREQRLEAEKDRQRQTDYEAMLSKNPHIAATAPKRWQDYERQRDEQERAKSAARLKAIEDRRQAANEEQQRLDQLIDGMIEKHDSE